MDPKRSALHRPIAWSVAHLAWPVLNSVSADGLDRADEILFHSHCLAQTGVPGVGRQLKRRFAGESKGAAPLKPFMPPAPRTIDPLRDAQGRLRREILRRSLFRSERLTLRLYYSEDWTKPRIGKVPHLSEPRVSRMHAAIRSPLRDKLRIIHRQILNELAA